MIEFIVLLYALTQVILAIFVLYHGTISFFGFLPLKKEKRLPLPEKKFAIVVAAHNEETVIEGAVESLLKLDYPRELYDIMVIADNCTDNTAKIARECGGLAFERFDTTERGKGFALKWMFNKIYNMDKHYDAIVVLDADNIVCPKFLKHMNGELLKGKKIIQGYLDSKNPNDTWVTSAYAISYWYMARIWQDARKRVGLPNALGGTGMCFEVETLKKLGWDATSLTEDLEFTIKAVLNGVKPSWNHYAVVYDEKPLHFKASWNQRLRWMQGHWDVATRYFKPLLKRFFTKGDFSALDCAFYLIQPVRIVLLYFSLSINTMLMFLPDVKLYEWMKIGSSWPLYIWVALLFFQWFFPPVVAWIILLETKKLKNLSGIFTYQIFGTSWLPLTIIAFFTKDNKVWSHTQHTRKISVEELTTSK